MSDAFENLKGSIYDTLFVASKEKELGMKLDSSFAIADPYDASQTRSIADKKIEASSKGQED